VAGAASLEALLLGDDPQVRPARVSAPADLPQLNVCVGLRRAAVLARDNYTLTLCVSVCVRGRRALQELLCLAFKAREFALLKRLALPPYE
jgi:hypothetical protein